MDHHRTEVTGRRTLFNGLVTAAARSWRHGLQPSCGGGGHTSNAMVFPTVSAAASPTCRTPVAADVSTTAEEQRIRLQQQRHREHRLNVLWYGGEDTHHQQQQQAPTILFESQNHRCQSTDDWEKRPLRRRRRKSRQHSRRGRNRSNKRPGVPAVPVVWAAVLLAVYAIAMAATYHVYGATAGSGWVWLKSAAGHHGPLRRLSQLSPTLYYAVQASCAVAVGCFWWNSQRQHLRRLCCHVLLALFIAAICPSIPFGEVFGGGVATTATGNSTVHRRQQRQPDDHLPGDSDDNHPLAMYEGLWQVTFFVFVAYCLVLPAGIDDDESDGGNDETVKRDKRNDGARNTDEENNDVTTAVLLFSTLVSIGHTSLNAYTAYRWYFQQRYNRDDNSAAIQQFIANVVVLTCINLTGWLLRQSMVRDRAEIIGHGCSKHDRRNRERVRFALRRQTNKLNLLLTSLLPKRVFSEMKYDIVTDAARSRNNVTCSNDEDYQNDPHLQRLRQELQLHTSPQLPKMYMKEYSDVSVVCANVTGFWENASEIAFHNETDSQQSRQLTELIDKLMVDLFNRLARRNGCVTTRLLGNRIFFVAGLPAEEHYGLDNDECNVTSRQLADDGGHAKNAVQLGLDLIDTVNMVTHHVSRRRCSHKINLGIRVGVHSGKVTCGVLGFVSATGIHSDLGSRWQYELWGHDVLVASNIESSGRPGWVHVTQATVDQITKDRITVPEGNHPVPKGVMRNKAIKYGLDSSNNMHDYTFKKGNDYDQMDTYFVVPNTTKGSNSEMNGGNPPKTRVDTHDNDGIDNYYGENFESLILQSVDRQIQLEEIRRQYNIDFTSKIEATSAPLPLSTTTAASSETPMIPAAPGTTMKMIMNRHRRSRYEQEPLQAVATKLNISSTTAMKHHNQWDDEVFGDYDNDDHDKIKRKSDDDDLFRLAKSQLLLLCVIIALFVVNVTTMPWTILLGITFITPFVVTAGGLIYVMALLIDWIPRPRFCSTAYTTAIIADDEEYYQHYDSDNYDSDSTCTSTASSSGCLRRLFICDRPRNYSLFAWLSKPFRWGTNTTMMNRSPPDDSNSQQRCTAKWYHCCRRGHYGWFTWCLDNDETPSWISSDDSDIESRLGFRNENAIIMAATAGILPPQQLQNQLHHPQTINVKHSHNTGRLHQRHSQSRRKYQDEERHTWFFWLAACSEMFVILLVCLLALLNAFTCEPVTMTATNAVYSQLHTINNGSVGFNTTRLQQLRSPLVCPWPQYVVLTCCLACVSIAIAFPIYYGSLPTLRWKITILFTMTCVFAVAFVHFTHKHVFIAASVSSFTPTCCLEVDNIHNHQTINMTIRNIDHHPAVNGTIRHELYQEDQQQSKLQEQQRAAGLDTAITTVYVIIFAAAMLVYFTYAHHLQKRRAYHKVNINRDVRRLNVLRTAHRRTLRAVMPDHVAHMLRSSCISNANDADNLCEETQRKQNNVSTDTRLIPVTITDHQGREQIPSHPRSPFYHCSYQNVVVMFATIVKQDIPLVTSTLDNNANDGHQQLSIFLDTFIEFDRLLDDQKFRGLVDKIKMIGTETYMAAVGLQYPHKPDHQLLMLLNEIKQRNKESCHNNDRDKKNNIDSYNGSGVSVVNNLENVFELHNMISANYVIFALDFIRGMRRALHRRQAAVVTPVGYSHNSQPTQFTLQVGVNVGPVVAGLIGCNNRLWKRPQFDIWGNTVNMAEQMDLTGIPGSTHVTHRVVDVLNSIKDPVYAFDELTNTKDNRSTYIVRENFHRDEYHRLVQQQFNGYQQSQPLYRQIDKIHKNHEPDRHQQQQQQYKRPAVVRSPQNAHRTMTQQVERDQPLLNAAPVVTVHPQHSYYNAMVQQELRLKHPTPLKTPPQKTPPPPPPRSPPSANVRRTPLTNYPPSQHQHSGERDQRADRGQRSRGVQQNENRQQNRRTSDATTTTVVTYARPLQKQTQQQQQLQQSNNSRHSPNSCSAPAPRVLGPIFDGEPKQQLTSTHRVPPPPTAADAKPAYSANRTADGTAATNQSRQQQQQRKPCRPTVLDLVNTTAVSSKRFDADRPLPAPPRSSDTVAGRQRHHNDPRRRRRQQQQNQPPATASRREQHQVRPTIGNDRCQATAWPSTSSFRSPVSVDSLASVSSLSSSGSTDAGNTTTSNNNYNTTTTASSCSSDDSFGRTEDDVDDRADTEDLDTAASSAAVSPVHRRYHQHRQQQYHQQHNLLLRQWSPSTTANSSPVRRSSSFRSPLSTTANTAVASSSSLRSPPVPGHPVAGFGGTQSLNRRRLRPVNVTSAAGPVGSGSGRRRRRRQQQNSATSAGPSTPPSAVVPDADVVSAVATEKYDDSPPSSLHWKKLLQQQQQMQQMQRRQVTDKDQGTAGGGAVASPDFTDEIRRILLLDHHRGSVRQQQQEMSDGVESHDDFSVGKQVIGDDVIKPPSYSSEQQQHRTVTDSTTGRNSDKENEKNRRDENDGNDDTDHPAAAMTTTTAAPVNMSSAASSSFEERERQMTEQVERQQAEVRRILQAHKNNVVAVVRGTSGTAAVTAEAILHHGRRRLRVAAAESSEWSDDDDDDDESVEPSSLLDDGRRVSSRRAGVGSADDGGGGSGSVLTADTAGDGYTTDTAGDGYTTAGYTTDDAAADRDGTDATAYVTDTDLPVARARQLDDNLSTMNDTGLTDAEAALSDVNSMIDFNDCNDRNRYGSRRQSSLSGSSACPYASDSFCEDDDDYNDDDDDDDDDDDELIFQGYDRYNVDNEKPEFRDDQDNNGRRYDFRRLLQQHQRQLSPLQQQQQQPSSSDGACAINNNRLHARQEHEPRQSTSSQDNACDAKTGKRHITSDSAAATTCMKTTTATNTSPIADNASNDTPLTATTMTAAKNIEADQYPSSPTVKIKDNSNIP